ncbi:hypothetical protein ACYOEI_15335 [Singulisphaera rosea]
MKQVPRWPLGIVFAVSLVCGCGSEDRETQLKKGIAAPSNRLLANDRFKDERFKKMIGKNGKMLWRPGVVPKQFATDKKKP